MAMFNYDYDEDPYDEDEKIYELREERLLEDSTMPQAQKGGFERSLSEFESDGKKIS